MLHDVTTGQNLQSIRPSVIVRSGFIDARIAINQIVKVADLPDEATDEDFASFWTESGDRELAIASFLSKFEPAPEKPEKPVTTPRKGK